MEKNWGTLWKCSLKFHLKINLIVSKKLINYFEFGVACDAGSMFNISSGTCEPCGYGYYQPVSGAFTCIPCGVGKTTLTETSTAEDECRDECFGEYLKKNFIS